ncbi:hypothetical protein GCM10012320_26160 [Sinomonas cellulolyticus]|uniref:ABC transporter substrate-binding protein n=1 Tax=Sinomonas cellulolyticus TaxID=2801916 RepID=A0ABS1K623_9MICC|nr:MULTISPECIES: ABC transporter substrate-binding protein [Sinomonas]MBL0707101.1 ABC transporter substrate-binding protein [Sinomonas cellulolyticus]GHG54715.1 hypothetical protein GCM10012320_26160 [Sinomonas sp. KCTC 49339]
MSQPIDVGTVIGGRYKVTSSIVTSQGGDLVLDGVDQVLNRPVSILVAGRANADQLAQSAREVAMGERHGAVQVLDLGISQGSTYLITNHTDAADLLDLIVPQETPYVEPFFTDTLGSELFGESRSHEPETYDGTVDPGRPDEYIRYDDHDEVAPSRGAVPGRQQQSFPAPRGEATQAFPPAARPRDTPGAGPAQGAAAAAAAAAAASRPGATPTSSIPPPPAAPPRSAPSAGSPGAGQGGAGSTRVTPWPNPQDRSGTESAPTAAAPVQPQRSEPREHRPSSRPAAVLPAAARPSYNGRDAYDDDDESTKPRSMPWLVGGILAVVLIAALIFAFTTLGGLFQPQQAGTASSQHPAQQAPSSAAAGPSSAAATSAAPAPAAAPEIESVTRLNPGELTFANSFDSKLPLTFDGNPATFWSGMEFAREDWGGFTKSVVLAVKLKDPAQIKQVTLLQSGGSGGNFSIYTNNDPSLTGAALAGTSSFTGPQVTVPVSASPTAQYVLIQINSLPRLSAPQTQYPFGLRLAEIKVE